MGTRNGIVRIANGLQSGDDGRWVRLYCEVPCAEISSRWHGYLKPIDFQPYVAEVATLIDWGDRGYRIKEAFRAQGISPTRYVSGESFYFSSGCWYPDISELGLGVSPIFHAAIPSRTGLIIVCGKSPSPATLTTFLNSRLAVGFLGLWTPDRHHKPTYVGQIPYWLDQTSERILEGIYDQLMNAILLYREAPFGPNFKQPWLLDELKIPESIRSHVVERVEADCAMVKQLISEADHIVGQAFSDAPEERVLIEDAALLAPVEHWFPSLGATVDSFVRDCIVELCAYCLGVAVGQWDVRLACSGAASLTPDNTPATLPKCPPGMLVGPDGLPATKDCIASEEWLKKRPDVNTLPPEGVVTKPTITDNEYPLRISWDGLLVDDPGPEGTRPYRDDIVHRVREVLDLLWEDRAEAIEQEACEILGVRDLREYFRRPTGFFDDHLKRYSKSKRKAPIYWPLSTASGSYTVWVYYQRLTDQTLYTIVNRYVEPKIAEVERAIAGIETHMAIASGRRATQLRDHWQEARVFLAELHDFRQELLRVAGLPYKPDLNDGVIINAAPLHRLFRHRQWAKDTRDCWERLEREEYEWAHMAFTIWPERVREVCRRDRSIAIAHGLEAVYEPASPSPGRTRRRQQG